MTTKKQLKAIKARADHNNLRIYTLSKDGEIRYTIESYTTVSNYVNCQVDIINRNTASADYGERYSTKVSGAGFDLLGYALNKLEWDDLQPPTTNWKNYFMDKGYKVQQVF